MGEMSNEERNKIMDQFLTTCEKLKSWNEHQGEFVIYGRIEDQLPAIRECDRKARAWDELEAEFNKMTHSCDRDERNAAAEGLNKMAELLAPPKPKSKLERLKEKAKQKATKMYGQDWVQKVVPLDILFQEIDRLEAEDDK